MRHRPRTLCVLVLAVSCGGASLAQLRERELCYERAETVSQQRVDIECRGVAFSACPAADGIMADLKKAQEACP